MFSKQTNWRYAAVVTLFFGLLLFWYFSAHRDNKAFQAIPSQSAAVLIFNGLGQVLGSASTQSPKIERGMLDFSLLQSGLQDIALASRAFESVPAVREALLHNRLVAAFSLLPVDSLHPLEILELAGNVDLDAALKAVAGQHKVVASVFKGQALYTVHLSARERLVVAGNRNLLLFSRFSYLVEDALVQLGANKSEWADAATLQTTEDAPFRIILHTPVLAERLKGQMNPLWAYWPDWLARQTAWLEVYRDVNSWSLHTGPLPGWLFPNEAGSGAREDFYTILPDNTALIARISLKAPSLQESMPPGISARDFQEYIQPWTSPTAAYILTEPFTPGMQEDQFWVIPVQDSSAAALSLKAFGAQRGLVKDYDYQTFEIRQFLSASLLAPLLGQQNTAFKSPVCAQVGSAVVFAASASAMELWIDKYVVSQTLGNMPDFLAFHQGAQAGQSADILVNFNFLPLLLKNLLIDDGAARFEQDVQLLQQLGFAGAEFKAEKKENRSANLHWQSLEAPANGASILWKLTLQGDAIGTPSVVPLDAGGGQSAIFIQDDRFFLYRLTPEGTIVWRKQMDQPLLSGVQGIDYLGNGQVGFLFNTADAIWILNDEGRELDGFPLRLQSKATNSVTMVDFDDTRNHTLFIACANENLYGFDQFGRPLPGWNPQTGVGLVSAPMVHFKRETEDYLAVLSTGGKLSVFNRNGRPHFAPVQWKDAFRHCPLQFDNSKTVQRWVCRGDAGKVYTCDLNGKVAGLTWPEQGTATPYLVYEDLTGDTRKEFALVNGRDLVLPGNEGQEKASRSNIVLPTPADTLFSVGAKGWLGTINKQKRQILLIDAQGRLHPDFPLAGSTPFLLNQLFPNRQEQILVVGNQNALYAYRLRKVD